MARTRHRPRRHWLFGERLRRRRQPGPGDRRNHYPALCGVSVRRAAMLIHAHKLRVQEPVPVTRRLATYHVARPSWNVLLVEDDPSDVALTRHALKRAYIPHHLHTVASGADAVKALRGACWPDFSSMPDVVFLDLHLPGKDG